MSLIKDGDNIAVRLLNTLGIRLQKMYIDILTAMGQNPNLFKEDLDSSIGDVFIYNKAYSVSKPCNNGSNEASPMFFPSTTHFSAPASINVCCNASSCCKITAVILFIVYLL